MTEELKKKINNHKNLKLLEKNGFCINSYTLKIINYPNSLFTLSSIFFQSETVK